MAHGELQSTLLNPSLRSPPAKEPAGGGLGHRQGGGGTAGAGRLTRAAPGGWQGCAQSVKIGKLIRLRVKPHCCRGPGCRLSWSRGPAPHSPCPSTREQTPHAHRHTHSLSGPRSLTPEPPQYLQCRWCWAWQVTLPRGLRRPGLEPRDQRQGVRQLGPHLGEEGGM